MNWENYENKRLVNVILLLKNKTEVQNFLRDLLTESELVEFTKRLQTAQLLTEKVPYSTIEKTTGLSSATIARVSKWLNGAGGGYKTILNRLHHQTIPITRRGLS